jgi:hypothetical protein
MSALLALALLAAAAEAPLADTGQTHRHTRSFGEDGDYAGRAPAFADNGDGTVTDKVTGLVWEKVDGGEMTWEKARERAAALRLAGKSDWRLPTSMELLGLMDHGRHGPAMDTAVFPRTEARYWWTSSPMAGDASRVWLVNSGGGIGPHPRTETTSAGGDRPVHVRCVRGACAAGNGPRLRDNGDGTVSDLRTGLVWQRIGVAQPMTWEQALAACESLRLAGKDDWRLPNIKELRSLSDDALSRPSVDRAFFPEVRAATYWSSTTQSNRPERAWHVDFSGGLVTYADKSAPQLVLAVRGGEVAEGPREKAEPVPRAGEDARRPAKDRAKRSR